MNVDQLVAAARQRLHAGIDRRCEDWAWADRVRANDVQRWLRARWEHRARSRGQRWRRIRERFQFPVLP